MKLLAFALLLAFAVMVWADNFEEHAEEGRSLDGNHVENTRQGRHWWRRPYYGYYGYPGYYGYGGYGMYGYPYYYGAWGK
ncbi:unnamed protein product [Allacma fusca]|uniref:Uncharacterized protein n=1 Tax=Allacma fusca TaxID=39272 RepID=A0A8J2LBS7_9HEXA|nr:unnamed protein product [Allacma fusca]